MSLLPIIAGYPAIARWCHCDLCYRGLRPETTQDGWRLAERAGCLTVLRQPWLLTGCLADHFAGCCRYTRRAGSHNARSSQVVVPILEGETHAPIDHYGFHWSRGGCFRSNCRKHHRCQCSETACSFGGRLDRRDGPDEGSKEPARRSVRCLLSWRPLEAEKAFARQRRGGGTMRFDAASSNSKQPSRRSTIGRSIVLEIGGREAGPNYADRGTSPHLAQCSANNNEIVATASGQKSKAAKRADNWPRPHRSCRPQQLTEPSYSTDRQEPSRPPPIHPGRAWQSIETLRARRPDQAR
jgi:hypothetical protein